MCIPVAENRFITIREYSLQPRGETRRSPPPWSSGGDGTISCSVLAWKKTQKHPHVERTQPSTNTDRGFSSDTPEILRNFV